MICLPDLSNPAGREFYVSMGSLFVGSGPSDILKTFVGSCVGLCLYDRTTKQGGLAHVMLPDSNGKDPLSDLDAKYADHALKSMTKIIEQRGGSRNRLVARIAGGATMFSPEGKHDEPLFNVGLRNITTLKALLRDMRIPILSEDIGSNCGRWLIFYLSSGQLLISKRAREGVAT